MVEDTVASGYFWLDNVIPIVPFTTDKLDKELLGLKHFLSMMSTIDQHTDLIRKYFKLHSLAAESEFEDALATILNT